MKFKQVYSSPNSAGLTDVGQQREINEDGFVIDEQSGLYLVADGMGGHRNGAVASQLFLFELSRLIGELKLRLGTLDTHAKEKGNQEEQYLTLSEWLANSVSTANAILYQRNQREGSRKGAGMGTAIAGIWKPDNSSNGAILFHVGDCRIYLYRRNRLSQLTKDHTLYQRWLDNNRSGIEPSKNIIVKAIGPYPDVTAELSIHHFEPGDTILICSDGLTNMLNDSHMREAINNHKQRPLMSLCETLIEDANEAGGIDNITVVVSRVGEE
ncbi:Protein serine/threonine phosphatase PrpC, regulation of stationary phase [hydrothermal vent metagenome]|uniref:Protein serine/threonine phosphatase PrpC, regulation of stationary phase n=1 Tax=hydrothermal vent metagenome TaxID=652676 RepID=A0A3B0ZCM5_9ZZZZ